MDANSKNAEDDQATVTKHVVDYYKKYSQNKDLPKYFSGTSVSYLPEMKCNLENETPDIVIKTDVDIVITVPEEYKHEELVDTSRASSQMSNRKLEWDSGADIGYNYVNSKVLHKSSSLPILTELKKKKHDSQLEPVAPNSQRPETDSTNSSNVKVVLLTCSSSSGVPSVAGDNYSSTSSFPDEKQQLLSSSSSVKSNMAKNIGSSSSDLSGEQKILHFKNTLSYLKQKIGLPGAHSTPNTLEGDKCDTDVLVETPFVKKTEKPVRQIAVQNFDAEGNSTIDSKIITEKPLKIVSHLENVDSSKKGVDTINQFVDTIAKMKSKIVNLCLTKPISVECLCSPPMPKDKLIQTKTKCATIGIQTDEISEKDLLKIIENNHPNLNQSLLFLEHSENDNTNTGSTQTSSDMLVSNCDSFEYVKSNPGQKYTLSNVSKKTETVTSEKNKIEIGLDDKANNLKTTEKGEEQSSLQDFCLSNFENVGYDIEKYICLLQKLIKSKKYDLRTKKRYIKKIINQITESKYMEESSNSSDLFFPKKTKLSTPQLTKTPSSESSEEKLQERALQKNASWRPLPEEKTKKSPRRKKLEIKTFSQEIMPNLNHHEGNDILTSPTEICPVDARDMTKNVFPLTNNEFLNHELPELKQSLPKTSQTPGCHSTDKVSLQKQYDSSSSIRSYQNWKENKTLSERLFEDKSVSNGEGDYLVKIAHKEREYQINWINNEISHLGKLKNLLEKPPVDKYLCTKTSQNVRVTKSVYKVTETGLSDKENGTKSKKYVIETHMGHKKSERRNFNLGGKNYTIEELTKGKTKSHKNIHPVLSDIEVVSSDNTINIKVKTFCEKCKREPCVCYGNDVDYLKNQYLGQNKMIGSTCTCNLTKENEEQESEKSFCSCSSIESSSKIICLCCHKNPCSCHSHITSTGAIPKKCYLCQSYPCSCYASLKSSTVCSGQFNQLFIPADYPKPEEIMNKYSQRIASLAKGSKKESPDKCTVCGKCPCLCDLTDKTVKIGSLTSKEDNILKKCTCITDEKCNCKFSEKLPNFENDITASTNKNIDDLKKSVQSRETKTEYDREHIAIQTNTDTKHQNLQTSRNEVDKPCECQDVGTQTQINIQDQDSQTLTEVVDIYTTTAGQPKKSSGQNTLKQVGNDRSTMTEFDKCSGVQYEKQKKVYRDTMSSAYEKHTRTIDIQTDFKAVDHSNGTKDFYSQTDKGKLENHKTQTEKNYQNDEGNGKIQSSTSRSTGSERNGRKITCICSDAEEKIGKGHHKNLKKSVACLRGSTKNIQNAETGSIKYAASTTSSPDNYSTNSSGAKTNSFDQKLAPVVQGSKEDKAIKKSSIGVCVCGFNEKIYGSDTAKVANRKPRSGNTKDTKKTIDVFDSPAATSSSNNEVSAYTTNNVTNNSESTSSVICICCKRKTSPENIQKLRNNNEEYPLCCSCIQKKPILTSVCYTGPDHVCTCLNLETIKKVDELSHVPVEYCTCSKPSRTRNSEYCSYCQFKLRRTIKNKNGIAYMLTLESGSPSKVKSKKRRRKQMEEIRVKIPCPYNRKKYKDKENFSKMVSDQAKIESEKYVRFSTNNDSSSNGVMPTKADGQTDYSKFKSKPSLTLQEHLKKNRPDFINSAEYRRRAVNNSKYNRELTKDALKIRFLDENVQNQMNRPQKLFTAKEMREITKRNYKKLPEVQQKLIDFRNERLRDADKFIVDTFTRKIQGSVLKGISSFPMDSRIVNLQNG